MSNAEALNIARKIRFDYPDVTINKQDDDTWTIDCGKQRILSSTDTDYFFNIFGYLEGVNAVKAA
jgi:hypothetical protein